MPRVYVGEDTRPNERDMNDRGAIERIPALDAVRGIAILLVVFLHFGVSADFIAHSHAAAAVWLDRVFYNGWAGVDLFFVLSGFLITSILVASKGQPHYFRRFYGRRALRIFPLYYLTLALGLIAVPMLAPGYAPQLLQQAGAGQIWLWTYSLNIAMSFGVIANAGVLGHFWTLAIEEQYYLVWPWLVKTLSGRSVLVVCGALAIGALIGRIAWMALGLEWGGAYRFTPTRIDALAIGSMLALLVQRPGWRTTLMRVAPSGFATGLAAVIAMNLALPRFYPSEWAVVTFGHSVLAAMFACLILLALRTPTPLPLRSRTLRALGKYSYGIYVWHWPLHDLLLIPYNARPVAAHPGFFDPLLFLAAGVVLSIVLGWLSYTLFERPFLGLKRFFTYQPPADSMELGPAVSVN
jgi:peptidoglycan/LPS O-acetylase OafA/YrhL